MEIMKLATNPEALKFIYKVLNQEYTICKLPISKGVSKGVLWAFGQLLNL